MLRKNKFKVVYESEIRFFMHWCFIISSFTHIFYFDNNRALTWTVFVPCILKYHSSDSSHALLEHDSALNNLSTLVLTRRREYQVQYIWTLLLCTWYKTWISNVLPNMEIYGATWRTEPGETPFDVAVRSLPWACMECFGCKEQVALFWVFFLGGGGWAEKRIDAIRI